MPPKPRMSHPACNQRGIRLRSFVVDKPELGDPDHHALLEITPIRLRRLSTVFTCVDRTNHSAAIVVSETYLIAEHHILSVRVFHCCLPTFNLRNRASSSATGPPHCVSACVTANMRIR